MGMFGYRVNLKERNDVWNGCGQSLAYVLVLVCVFFDHLSCLVCSFLPVVGILWFSVISSVSLYIFSLLWCWVPASIRAESFLLLLCFWTYDRNKVLQVIGYTGLYMDAVDKM
jgi:hypothetical protein